MINEGGEIRGKVIQSPHIAGPRMRPLAGVLLRSEFEDLLGVDSAGHSRPGMRASSVPPSQLWRRCSCKVQARRGSREISTGDEGEDQERMML